MAPVALPRRNLGHGLRWGRMWAMASRLVLLVDFHVVIWEGCRESRRCSRDTYPESYITKYTSIRSLADFRGVASLLVLLVDFHAVSGL